MLPRDAFNESSLLKCVGRLTLLIENGQAPDWAFYYDGSDFRIVQDQSDGSISVENIRFLFKGKPVKVFRTLNARYSWPMFALPEGGEEFQVFHYSGTLRKDGGES